MSVGAALMVDNIGRRKLFLSSGIIMLLSYVIITALSAEFANYGNKAVGTAVHINSESWFNVHFATNC